MGPLLFRLVLLAAGIGLGQMALDAFVRGGDPTLVQFAVALVLLAAGSAGFMVPLLERSVEKEVSHHV